MPKAERRRQLLDVAFDIVREDGTDALTLATLADRAGVTKPIAYSHFATRPGLLSALYRDYEERQNAAMHAAVATGGRNLDDVARIVSAAYVDCVLTAGPECEEIAAALAAYEETKDFLQSSRDYYVEEFRKAFEPVTACPLDRGRAVLAGLLGAAEAIAHTAAIGHLSRDDAVAALTRIMVGSLAAQRRPGE